MGIGSNDDFTLDKMCIRIEQVRPWSVEKMQFAK